MRATYMEIPPYTEDYILANKWRLSFAVVWRANMHFGAETKIDGMTSPGARPSPQAPGKQLRVTISALKSF